MPHTKPNRDKSQFVHNNQRRKESGDQHFFPEDEPELDPHRPHRANREDMQKGVHEDREVHPESDSEEPTST